MYLILVTESNINNAEYSKYLFGFFFQSKERQILNANFFYTFSLHDLGMVIFKCPPSELFPTEILHRINEYTIEC